MFLLELYLKRRKAKARAWRRRGEEWVKENNDGHRYGAYSFRDYKSKYPEPTIFKSETFEMGVYILGAIAVLAVVAFAIIYAATAPPKKVDPNNPNGCNVVYKKGDKVGVILGPYDGSKGEIINQKKDCSVNITLTDSTRTYEKTKKNGWNTSYIKENGEVLNIDTEDNIIKL